MSVVGSTNGAGFIAAAPRNTLTQKQEQGMNLRELRQKREQAAKTMRDLRAKVEAENRLMTEEESTAFDAAFSERETLDREIARAEAVANDRRTEPTVGVVIGANNEESKPFANLGEQLMAVKTYGQSRGRTADPRLFSAALGQNETVDSEGGFLVAPEVSTELLTRTFESAQVASRCRIRPMASSRLVINGVDDANRVGGPAGVGILVNRVAEAQGLTLSKMKFRRVELNANKMIGAYAATDEILEDAPALQAEIQDYFPEAFSWKIDNEVLNGTGQGQFLGINISGATVVTPKQTGQPAGTVSTQNFLDMRARLWVRSRKNAAWFVGPDVEEILFTLTIPGPQGTAVALYTPPGVNGNDNEYGLLLGLPVIVIEQTAPLGQQGDVLLGDMQQYIIGERNGIKFASSIHVAFLTDEQIFRWTLRNDGQPLWDKPVTQNNSANKVSPFVTLAARQ